MTPRTLRLVEYRPRGVRLRGSDVDFLVANARQAIELVPTRERNRYRLTAQGVVGVLHTPNLRIVISPKIPAANLFHLLDPDAPPELFADQSQAEPGTEAIDFLARRLAAGMRQRAAAGLRRQYVERSDSQPFLQGRLDLAAQLRESPATRDRFNVTRQEFTADSPINRLPRATAELLLASPFVSPATRAALRDALAGYAEVGSIPPEPAAFDSLVFDALTEPERPFIGLCRLLAESLQPNETGGDGVTPGFLINLERVFERYIERGLRAHFPGIDSQREFCYHAPVPENQPALIGRPDFVIRVNGKPACVLDAKWKALDGPPPAADVHQALAYSVGLRCRDVRLIYPGGRWAAWKYEMAGPGTSLTIHTVRVIGAKEKCEQSMRRLVRSVG